MKEFYKYIVLFVIILNTVLVCVNIGLVFFKTPEDAEHSMKGVFLTTHLKQGHIKDAQKLAKVQHPKFLSIDSYSGYLTVNASTHSHMFFWYFPSAKSSSNTPLILWLNGGPGWSSLYGLFTEIGPFYPISATELALRKHSWHKQYNLLFIDNPVGAGFSLTRTGYATNITEVGRDLYAAMRQFYRLFPEIADNEFYIAGESYAGKYIPALAHTIHENNLKVKQKINLKGLIIGNGLSDPISQLNYADYLYQHGLVDMQEADVLRAAQDKCIDLIANHSYLEAYKVFSDIIFQDSEFTPHGTLFANFTGFSNVYNYLIPDDPDPTVFYMEQFLNNIDVKHALHVDDIEFNLKTPAVLTALRTDVLQSVKSLVEELLSHYRILLFAGQLDVIVAYPGVDSFIRNMTFSGDVDFFKAKREKWYVDEDLAGYSRTGGNLTEVMVRNAGHVVPKDQPIFALDMLEKFINRNMFN